MHGNFFDVRCRISLSACAGISAAEKTAAEKTAADVLAAEIAGGTYTAFLVLPPREKENGRQHRPFCECDNPIQVSNAQKSVSVGKVGSIAP